MGTLSRRLVVAALLFGVPLVGLGFTSVDPTCDDLSGIDFGSCRAILGYGVIAGSCQPISGCESPVPLFASLTECVAACVPVATERRTWGTLKARYDIEP